MYLDFFFERREFVRQGMLFIKKRLVFSFFIPQKMMTTIIMVHITFNNVINSDVDLKGLTEIY